MPMTGGKRKTSQFSTAAWIKRGLTLAFLAVGLLVLLDQLGFNFRFATADGEVHYQEICPMCRRRLLALNQGRALGR